MKKVIFYIFIASILLCTIFSQKVSALSCVEPNISDWMNDFDGAIVATVTDVRVNNNEEAHIVSAKVNESYKGVDSETITFLEVSVWAKSNVDNTYMYFLVKNEEQQWVASSCTTIAMTEGNAMDKYAELQQYPKVLLLAQNVQLETNESDQLNPQSDVNLLISLLNNYQFIFLLGVLIICLVVVLLIFFRNRKN